MSWSTVPTTAQLTSGLNCSAIFLFAQLTPSAFR